jgi:hypothetical protein
VHRARVDHEQAGMLVHADPGARRGRRQGAPPPGREAGHVGGQVDGPGAGLLRHAQHGLRPAAAPDHQRTAPVPQAPVQVGQ